MTERGIVIVGGGECGGRAALDLRTHGYQGPITLIGDERHTPYERPPLSKGLLDDQSRPKFIATINEYASKNIDLVLARAAVAIDRQRKSVHLDDRSQVAFSKLLLATGASPRTFPGRAFDGKRILALRTHADACALQNWIGATRHIAIIGGGFIGLELAATARIAGANVTVIEGLPRVLMRGVPAPFALKLQQRHVSEGVDLRVGLKIDTIETTHDGVHIALSDHSVVKADILVVGIGAVPNVFLAENAGLQVDNGVVVDDFLRTSDPDIFAAGDCCNFPLQVYDGRRVRLESWRNAQEQGALAALNMLGAERPLSTVPWFWSDQYDLTLQVAGLFDEAANSVERVVGEEDAIIFHLAADGRLVAASGLGKGNSVARDIRLAELLIARRAYPDPETLRDPSSKLKSLLQAA
jgi:3-phenylpropionate/trans-cinnamate dioxygenase ferredoxin reductase subunit